MPQKGNLCGIDLAPRSTELLAFGFGRSKSGPNAIPDQFSLELGDAGKDSENQSSIRRRSVYTFVQANKVNLERPKLVERVHELPEAAVEPVAAINHHAINQAFAACDDQPVQCRPALLGTADALAVVEEKEKSRRCGDILRAAYGGKKEPK